MIEIIPAILTDNLQEVREKLLLIDGNVKRVQIDIIDGVFAGNTTVTPQNLIGVDTEAEIDFHLMVDDPIKWVDACAQAQAERIIAHIEMMPSQREFVEMVTALGIDVGLAIDLNSPVESIDKSILTDIDVVLVMSVEAGFGGQKFDPNCIDKIRELEAIKRQDATPFKICVDGGETLDTVDDVVAAGADEVVIGRRLFEGNINDNISKFKLAVNEKNN